MTWNVTVRWAMKFLRKLGALVMLLPLCFVPGCGKEEAKKDIIRPVKVMQIGGFERLGTRSFPGQAKATQVANLSFRVSGPLIEFPAKVGDVVKKDDLLARIDPRDFQIEIDRVSGQLRQAKAALTLAKSDYERLKRIRAKDPGAISEAAIDAKKGELDSARAQVESSEAAEQNAKDNLSYTYLKAPYDGTVVETFVDNYEEVSAKQEIIRVVDPSRIEFTINIPENLISYAPYVKKIWVRFDPYPDHEIPATVKEIGKEASKTTRTYPVTLIMDQPGQFQILPGMAGRTARIEGNLPEELRTKGLAIPVNATFAGADGKTFVWIIDEKTNQVFPREIQTGKLTNLGVEVVAGLEPSELIVTAGVHSLVEGQQVKILQ